MMNGEKLINEKKELELYVHIPFCVTKCAYCDFLSFSSGQSEMEAYVDALVREIESHKTNFRHNQIQTIFLGGGTPSLLEERDTARIFRALRDNFHILSDAEITMEVNPGTVTYGKASSWKKSGVNRISIGLQSVEDNELKMLGRIHTFREFLDTWDILRGQGFDNINVDLISAIPGQTLSGWEKTVRTTAELGPEHISAYSLIIEEGTLFHRLYAQGEKGDDRTMPPLPDEDSERQIYKVTQVILKEYGYHRYEISNYAKGGYECRHNLGYWERKEYLGLGLGSSSLIKEQRFHNTWDMGKYVGIFSGTTDRHGPFPAAEEFESLSERDQMEEFLFLGLRKMQGISEKTFLKHFGQPVETCFGKQIDGLIRKGLLDKSGGRLYLTERGIDISNYVFSELLL